MLQRAGRLKLYALSRQASSSSFNQTSQDLYSTLGIDRTASQKEVKSAFYELSKKYHPDRNPNDKESASVKFQSIVNAYEVLSNADKRKVYDAQIMPPRYQNQQGTTFRRSKDAYQKKYDDLDLDFKDFEQFQRAARRRQNSSTFTYENSDEFLKRSQQYKSSLAAEREREERRIREELEEKLRRSRYRTPTFEQLIQHERMRKAKKFQSDVGVLAIFAVILVGSFIFSGLRH